MLSEVQYPLIFLLVPGNISSPFPAIDVFYTHFYGHCLLYTLPTPICCRSLVSTKPLLPAISALLPPQYGTHSLLVFTLVLHHILSVVFLNPLFRSGLQFPLAAHTSASDSMSMCTIKNFIYLLKVLK